MLYRETRKNACCAAYDTYGNCDFASSFDWFVALFGLLWLANVWDYSDLCFKSDYQKANHNVPTQWTNQSPQ